MDATGVFIDEGIAGIVVVVLLQPTGNTAIRNRRSRGYFICLLRVFIDVSFPLKKTKVSGLWNIFLLQ